MENSLRIHHESDREYFESRGKSVSSLNRRSSQGPSSRASDKRRQSTPIVNEFLLCPHCGCRYKGKSSFTTHLRKKHPEEQKETICHVCNSCMDETIFERHFREHQALEMSESQKAHRLLKCDFCDFSCDLDVDMIQHTGIDHEGNNVFSMARTQAQFLTKTRNSKRKVSEDDSEKTQSGTETPEVESEEIVEETVVHMDGTLVVENDPRTEILLCLKRGQSELMENGYTDVMLHHLLISTYERSWMKLLVASTSKHIRLPIQVSALAQDERQLTNFVIENEVPSSLRKLFQPNAWNHLEAMVRLKRSQYKCLICKSIQNSKMIQCSFCGRRYHQSCSAKLVPSQIASSHSCNGCYL